MASAISEFVGKARSRNAARGIWAEEKEDISYFKKSTEYQLLIINYILKQHQQMSSLAITSVISHLPIAHQWVSLLSFFLTLRVV